MTTSLISLKPSCQNRLLSQGYPSVSQRIFTLQAFSSPHFLESYIFASKDSCVIDEPIHISTPTLVDFINRTNQTFSEIRRKIDILQDRFITNLASLSSSNQEQHQEIQNLKYMMQKLHQKLRQNNFDNALLEEFTKLRTRYDQLKKKDQSHRMHANVPEAIKMLDGIAKSLTATIDEQLSAITLWNIKSAEVDLSLDVRKTHGDYRCKTKLVSNNKYKQEEIINGTIVELKGREYYLFAEHRKKMRLENGTMRMMSLNNGKLLSSLKSREVDFHSFRTSDNKMCPKLRYMKSLNLGIAFTTDRASLEIYRIFPDKIKKIRKVWIHNLSSEIDPYNVKDFVVLEPQNIIAICDSRRVVLVNILTGKAYKTFEFEHYSEIYGVQYIQDLKSL